MSQMTFIHFPSRRASPTAREPGLDSAARELRGRERRVLH